MSRHFLRKNNLATINSNKRQYSVAKKSQSYKFILALRMMC